MMFVGGHSSRNLAAPEAIVTVNINGVSPNSEPLDQHLFPKEAE
jgi:hypothetical protein